MKQQIKNCVFCGGQQVELVSEKDGDSIANYVICPDCGARTTVYSEAQDNAQELVLRIWRSTKLVAKPKSMKCGYGCGCEVAEFVKEGDWGQMECQECFGRGPAYELDEAGAEKKATEQWMRFVSLPC